MKSMTFMKAGPGLSRRGMLRSMAALTVLAAAPGAAAISRKQVTFVLVHGAWHGGWSWKRLAPFLRAAGHQVYAPTMTGMAERAHQLNEDVDLDRHVQDIVETLFYEDLREVVLVGHSSGGPVITGVAEKVPERLSHLIYLDAFLLEDAKALSDYAPIAPTRADGWRVPAPRLDFVDGRVRAWAELRLTDQPMKTFTQPLQISADRTQGLAKTYIQLSNDFPWFNEAAARAKRNGYGYRSFISNHEALLDQPAAVAKILQEVV